MRLSKSKINTYLKCPLEFKYQYIDKITPEESIYLQIGKEVHQLAEQFIYLYQENKIEDNFLKTMYDLNKKHYPETNYHDHCYNLAKFFKETIIDKKLDVYMAEEYLMDEKHNFSGIADIVLRNPKDDTLTIIDYKTGKTRSITPYRRELCYYKMLIEELYPEENITQAGVYFTKEGDYRFLNFTDSTKKRTYCDKTEYHEYINLIDEVRFNINQGKFPPKKQFLCKYCTFSKQCQKDNIFF